VAGDLERHSFPCDIAPLVVGCARHPFFSATQSPGYPRATWMHASSTSSDTARMVDIANKV
jgi:hypothetical protein